MGAEGLRMVVLTLTVSWKRIPLERRIYVVFYVNWMLPTLIAIFTSPCGALPDCKLFRDSKLQGNMSRVLS